jgi:hypothetical protein|tara:strand:- start:142 stop:324 length:183 start_codon:yes stop_codon:yes gene_type:complete
MPRELCDIWGDQYEAMIDPFWDVAGKSEELAEAYESRHEYEEDMELKRAEMIIDAEDRLA